MNRYLLNISYIGTNFRGIQRTIKKAAEAYVDTTTIQGCIELALRGLYPKNEIETFLSSRTDSGVHALHSTLHVDLQHHNNEPYDTTIVTGVLNRQLDKHRFPIRVLSTQQVPDTFHCRYNALGRTYLYRFAVAKKGITNTDRLRNQNYLAFLPVEELDRCYFLQNSNFDIQRMRAGSHMFLGRHNFRTFTSVNRTHSFSRDHPRFTLRSIDEINIRPSRTTAFGPNAEKAQSLYDYWEIEFKARSFLYKQVRRMVATLLALSTGRVDERCVYEMLTIPSKNSWDQRINLAPAFGLYLSRVHYNEQDLVIPQKINENELSSATASN